ncbi:DMT family transporter [Rhizorhapis suberifaciens]|uniref:Drug/metabolite transporter (DMT)-like permease n=1 Tax=Rhizorhapis suberifaciens TaxID=13656 RepID=A0A840HZT0_9SPHN|nr:DMT family transporter [Rhizorhapis suberifaciens]MBB4642964.1 drug/metabolite transporter (DMT)-like permease [Rhizorhapis suberifaciens]
MEHARAVPQRDTRSWRVLAADAAVLGIAMVWGASYPVAKGALAFAPVLVLIVYRFAITAITMTLLNWREIASAKASDVLASIMLGIILFSIFVSETFGVSLTSATNTAFIISLCTIITPMLDYGLAKRLPPFRIFIAALISCAGVAVLCEHLTALSLGDGLVLMAAMLRAVMVVSTKRLMRNRDLSSGALTALQSSAVFIMALILTGGLGTEINLKALTNIPFVQAILFLSLFCTIGAFYIQNAAVRRSSPTKVSFLMSTEPVFGLLFASILLAEPISIRSLVGGSLIVGGTIIGILGEASRKTAQ